MYIILNVEFYTKIELASIKFHKMINQLIVTLLIEHPIYIYPERQSPHLFFFNFSYVLENI